MLSIKQVKRFGGTGKQGGLQDLTQRDIERILGFKANVSDGDGKVTAEWFFTIEGSPCAIWDYKGSAKRKEWSFYGSALLTLLLSCLPTRG